METAVSAGRIDRNASDSDSAAPLEMGSVKDKIGRFTDSPHVVRPINHSGKDWNDGTHPPTAHDPLEHSSQKPAVPRKPVMLASTKPPEPIEIPTKPPTGQAESQKRPPFINELMGNLPGVRPAAPDHNSDRQSPSPHPSTSSNKPSPPSIQPRPKLPPRTGTSSSEQSSTSASPKRSLPLHIDRKPRLPPRRDTPPISRTNTDQGIIMQDNESPRNPLRSDMGTPSTRSLNENTSSLLDEPNIMVEPGPPKSTGTWPLASDREPPPARKVPPPPPRQRRAGPQGEQMVSPPRNTTPNHLETKHKITAPEQTRYETVWAANKGLYIPSPTDPFYDRYPPGASEMVINLVVRNIWSRSCLPSDVLQQIWDLVDRQNVRLLTREEFVVGMWLIDRVLEGGRLPGEVPRSFWGSLRSSSKVELL